MIAVMIAMTLGILLALSHGLGGDNRVLLLANAIVVLSFSIWWMQRLVRIFAFNQLTVPALWYWCFLAMIWMPGLMIFWGVTPEGYAYEILSGPHLATYFVAIQSLLLTVPAGIALYSLWRGFHVHEIRAYFSAPVEVVPIRPSTFLWFFTACLVVTCGYLVEVGELPLVELLRNPGEYASLMALREEAFSALDSPYTYLYSVVREAIYPFLIATALGGYLVTRSKAWFVLFLTTLGIGIFYAAVAIARGPVATIFLVMCSFYYLHRKGQISARFMAIALILIFSFPALVSWLSAGNVEGGWAIAYLLAVRLFYAPAYVAYVYFEVIPAGVPFQFGATSEKISWLLGRPFFDSGKYVLATIYPGAPDSGSAGGAFFADYYANFGMPGVLVGGLFTGALIQGLQIFLLRKRKTVLNLAAGAFFYYAFWMSLSRAMTTVLLSTGVVFVLLLWWMMQKADSLRNGIPQPTTSNTV